jgi:hypothetical protein
MNAPIAAGRSVHTRSSSTRLLALAHADDTVIRCFFQFGISALQVLMPTFLETNGNAINRGGFLFDYSHAI